MLEPEFSLMIFRRKKVALANHGLPNHVCPSLPSWFPSGYVFALKCFLTSYCTVPPGGQNLYRVRPASHCAHGVKLLTLQVYHGLSSFNARHGHFSGSFVKPLLFAAPKVSTSFLSTCFFPANCFLRFGNNLYKGWHGGAGGKPGWLLEPEGMQSIQIDLCSHIDQEHETLLSNKHK